MPVQPIAISHAMHKPPHEHFGFHARAADSTHIRTTVHVTYPIRRELPVRTPVEAAGCSGR
jgi:hypothetical protein